MDFLDIPLTSVRSEVRDLVERTVGKIKAGEYDALRLKAQLKVVEAALSEIDKLTKDEQLDSFYKHSQKSLLLHGFEIEKTEAGIKYDYTGCGDTILNRLYADMELLKEKVKDREKLLKAIKDTLETVDKETGELIILNPPVRVSTTSLRFSMK